MDIDILSLFYKSKSRLWIAALLAVIGIVAGWLYASRIQPVPYAETTLLTLDTDRSSILGLRTTLEDVTVSRRIATELIGIIYSSKVTRTAARYLEDEGYQVNATSLASMVSISPDSSSPSVLILTARSDNPELVVPAANAMAQAFVDILLDYTGATYARILDPAETTKYTSGGNKLMYSIAGAIGGIALGLALIYLILLIDNRIETVDDLSRVNGVAKIIIIPLHNIK